MGEMNHEPAFAAFYGLLQVQARLVERIGAEVEGRTGLPPSWLEVLVNLKKGGRLRMSDLADQLLLSRGGATRLVARMEEAGLIAREIPPSDRRATYAVLTPAGLEAAESGVPVYLEALQRYFGAHLEDEDVRALQRIFARLLQANEAPPSLLGQVLETAGEQAGE
jgi:MarR family 2-MHQ and catechol resistance regulon transcriptional repressor